MKLFGASFGVPGYASLQPDSRATMVGDSVFRARAILRATLALALLASLSPSPAATTTATLSSLPPAHRFISSRHRKPTRAAQRSHSRSPVRAAALSRNPSFSGTAKPSPPPVVSATTVTATVSAALIAKPGTNFVNTLNPFSGTGTNGLSNVVTFPRQSRRQSRSRPSLLCRRLRHRRRRLFHSHRQRLNFIPTSDPSGGSQVRFNLGPTQTSLPILNITSTQIQATVDSSLLVNATTAPVTAIVTVYNPPAAGTPAGSGGVANPTVGWRRHQPQRPDLHRNPAGTLPPPAARRSRRRHSRRQRRWPLRRLRRHARRPRSSFCPRYLRRRRLRLPVPHALLSAASDGTVGNADSRSPSMSSDGRYIAFSSAATNLAIASATSARRHAPNLFARHLLRRHSTRARPSTQLVSTDPHRRARRHRRHPAIRQRLRPLHRVPRGDAKPRNSQPKSARAAKSAAAARIHSTAASARSSSATPASAPQSARQKQRASRSSPATLLPAMQNPPAPL